MAKARIRPATTMMAYLHPGTVSHNFMHSVLATLLYEKSKHKDRLEIVPVRSGPFLAKSRNSVVEKFLNSTHDWLWFVDSDMGFYGNTLENMLNIADPNSIPVLSALCFGQFEEESNGLGGWALNVFPSVFTFTENDTLTNIMYDYPKNSLVKVDAVGSACIIIHRSALEKIKGSWYNEVQDLGEDLSFCKRLKDSHTPVHVHTGLATSHQKPYWI